MLVVALSITFVLHSIVLNQSIKLRDNLNKTINLTCPPCVQKECYYPEAIQPTFKITCPEAGLLYQITQSVPYERNYVLDEYDCTERSDEIVRRLRNAGFTSQRVTRSYNGTKHDIVYVKEIYIEPSTGDMIRPDDYEKYDIQ